MADTPNPAPDGPHAAANPNSPGSPPAPGARLRRAIALRYDKDKDAAPTVIASGQGLVADKIIERARDNAIPVEENADLADALAQVAIGEAIPEELYPVVAEILVFISRMNKQRGESKRGR